ncbi:hypothetical protein GCM10027089_43730 [Nocardia thraciensis]
MQVNDHCRTVSQVGHRHPFRNRTHPRTQIAHGRPRTRVADAPAAGVLVTLGG